ncbi:MAG: hypothetical protein WAK13_10560 [Terriglobales bacterium]
MKRLTVLASLLCLVLAFGVFAPAACASQWNQKMELTFNQPIEVPGVVLQAGTYWFVLAKSQSNRDIVQIYNQDRSKLCKTTIAVPSFRDHASSLPEVQLAEQTNGSPNALLKIYYPGMRTGHQFVYRHREEGALRQDVKLDVFSNKDGVVRTATIPGA